MWQCPNIETLYAATETTWPAARRRVVEGWTLRDGQGGGKRVSSATRDGGDDPIRAEAAMRASGITPLFMVRAGEADLDAGLAARGYRVIDPVTLYATPVGELAGARPGDPMIVAGDHVLAVMAELWEAGGIKAPRLAVMARAAGPKAYLLGRQDDRPAAVGFVACDGDIAMLHALEVSPKARRSGLGAAMTRAAARWGQAQGVRTFALMTTDANVAANALYRRLGMQVVGHYHYRILPEQEPKT